MARKTNTAPDGVMLLPPHDVAAEQAVIGALMLDARAFAKVADFITADDFYRADHQIIFTSIAELRSKDLPCDAVTMGEWLFEQGLHENVGGTKYVMELLNSTPSAANVVAYAEIVKEKSTLRRILDVLVEGQRSVLHGGRHSRALDIVASTSMHLATLADVGSRTGPRSVRTVLKSWYQKFVERHASGERFTGLLTPWRLFNELSLGLQPGLVYIIAGRPSMGKSVLGFQILAFAGLRGKRGIGFTLEMPDEDVTQRMLSLIGEIPHEQLRSPATMEEHSFPKLTAASELLYSAPILLDQSPRLTARQICARAEREHLRAPLELMVVDHLQEVDIKGDNPAFEIGQALKEIRACARKLNIPLVMLCQLNRSGDNRPPTMKELKGSGDIEQIADVIVFVHRPDYYEPERMKGVVQLIPAKGRNMPLGKAINLFNRYDQMRAEDWPEHEPMPQWNDSEEERTQRSSPMRKRTGYARPSND